ALVNAMLHHIIAQGLEDRTFVADRMHDFDRVRESVKAMTPDVAAKITGVPADRIRWAAEIYAGGPNTSTLWAMGLTQHANGTDLVTSLHNLMLACGLIGRWGGAMMPVRGQELEFLAVHALFLTETARYADVVLPGSSFAEKTGTFVNTERRIQLARQAVASPGQARGDLEILIDLSNRLGLKTRFETSEAVMREIARVTPSWRGVTYQRLEGAGLQYPVPTDDSAGTSFLFDDRFPTADG